MKIVYIIGNGFDLNLGLKTSYSSFLSYYKRISTKSTVIRKFKERITSSSEKWSDLEIQLGLYTEYVDKKDEFEIILGDVVDKLAIYLKKEEDKFDQTNFKTQDFLRNLISPDSFLLPSELEDLGNYKNAWSNYSWNIDIITLNYTKIIERIFENEWKGKQIGVNHNNIPIRFGEIYHLHGYYDNRMILGVNDPSQIKNINFANDPSFQEAFIKSEFNKVSKQQIDDYSKKCINSANLICIFGCSIGETDKIWWDVIGHRLINECRIIIFWKCNNNYDLKKSYLLKRKEDEIRSFFLSKVSLPEEEKEKIRNKIYVAVNTLVFNTGDLDAA